VAPECGCNRPRSLVAALAQYRASENRRTRLAKYRLGHRLRAGLHQPRIGHASLCDRQSYPRVAGGEAFLVPATADVGCRADRCNCPEAEEPLVEPPCAARL